MEQILIHLWGDYVIQTQWMAERKRASWWAAWVHGVTYTLPFLFLTQSLAALSVICVTHVLIDHWGLARHVVYAKNQLQCLALGMKAQYNWFWDECKDNCGAPPHVPFTVSFWVMVIVDNCLHLTINYFALKHL